MRRLLALIAVVCAVAGGSQPETLTITNITVIDGTGAPARAANVIVRNGLIADVSAEPPKGEGASIDGTGKFLIPGLWDMHVHLATRPEPELAERMMLPLFLANGIVGVRDMGGPLERVLELREKVASGALAGPRILTPGPFVDGPGEADALFRRRADAAAAAFTVKELLDKKVDFIKVQAALAPDVHAAVARAAREAHAVFAGHIPVAMTAEQAIASGQRSLEHLSPALVGDGVLLFSCSRERDELLAELRAIERDRGSADAAAIASREHALRKRLVDSYDPERGRALGRMMKGREVWIVPTLVWSATLRPLDRKQDASDLPMDLVPVTLRTRWLERRKQYLERQTDEGFAAAAAVAATAARAVRDMNEGGARILAGTDSFDAFVLPGYSLHRELELLVSAGLSPLQALQAATRTAAEFRGTLKTEGTIEAGKRADVVLLDADPLRDIANARRVHTVVVGGKLFARDQLDRIMDTVRTFAAR
jgi:imidazolonepropionase-like amidohydrolase